MDRANQSLEHDLTLSNDVLDVLSVELTDDLEQMRSRVTRGHRDHAPPVSHSVHLFIGGSTELKFFGDMVRRTTCNYCPQSLESTGNE